MVGESRDHDVVRHGSSFRSSAGPAACVAADRCAAAVRDVAAVRDAAMVRDVAVARDVAATRDVAARGVARDPIPGPFAAEAVHPFRVSTEEAFRIQERLAREVRLEVFPRPGAPAARRAAGVDVAYSRDGRRAWAAAVVMDGDLTVLDSAVRSGEPDRPYAPGLLAFREGALTLAALAALGLRPDVVFLDGHGVVHERRLGLASHIGVLTGLPTVGVPKTPFHAIDHLPDEPRGSHYVLTKEWGAQGAALRLRTGVKPVYVSPGHLMDLDSAIRLSLIWSTGRHKVPEPLAAAHTLSVRAKNGAADPEGP